MFRAHASLLVLSVLLVSGCDTLAPEDESAPGVVAGESDKLRHWGLLEGAGGLNGSTTLDSIGFIVTFRPGVTDPVAASDSVFYGQEVRRRTYYRDSFTGVAALVALGDLTPVLESLVGNPLVAFVEPDLPLAPIVALPTYLDQLILRLLYDISEWLLLQVRPWSVRHVGGHASWTHSGNGSGVVDADVYVIDGPVEHHDINVVERLDFLPEGAAPASTLHGTHVAGIIGAVDDGNGIVGIAPGARIHSLVVLTSEGTTSMSSLLDAIELVVQRKRDEPSRPMVANIAIGRDFRTTRLNALDYAIAEAVEQGVVVVVSAGNDSEDAATFSPAHARGAITVGASTRSDRFASSFSNWGADIDILAPGEDVLSVGNSGLWASMSGTSMASAHVAGAAALYLARNPQETPAAVLANIGRRAASATHVPNGTTTRRLDVRDL